MIREHDRVVLTAPVAKERLEIGDVGITTLGGGTAAVATVEASDVRPVTNHEITHARELTAR